MNLMLSVMGEAPPIWSTPPVNSEVIHDVYNPIPPATMETGTLAPNSLVKPNYDYSRFYWLAFIVFIVGLIWYYWEV